MPHHGNAVGDDGPDFVSLAHAALEFHGLGSGFHEFGGIGAGFLDSVVGVDGEVRNDEGVFGSAGNSGSMMDDLIQGDVSGVGKAEDDHAEGVTDEKDVHSGFVEKTSSGVIVSGERGKSARFLSWPGGVPLFRVRS